MTGGFLPFTTFMEDLIYTLLLPLHLCIMESRLLTAVPVSPADAEDSLQPARREWRVNEVESNTATLVVLFVIGIVVIFTCFAGATGRMQRLGPAAARGRQPQYSHLAIYI